MAKKSVAVISAQGDKVPFLRGILVQSLVEAGLSFKDAYAAARRVREAIAQRDEIDTVALRGQVGRLLEQDFGAELRRAYESSQERLRDVVVHTPYREAPFSVGILSRYLEGCAIRAEEALRGARLVQDVLRQRGDSAVDAKQLRRVVFDTLKRECCGTAADRFLSRTRFEASRQPLVILIGGASGTGKSTVSAELAYRLEISRTQSTDFIREIIRAYLAPHVVPTLGYSSFVAWRGLPGVEAEHGPNRDDLAVAGFLSQAGAIKAALAATIARAVKERQDLILDGVHVLPSLLDLSGLEAKAVLVPITLAVTTRERLARQLARRNREQPDRHRSRYREQVGAIWKIQAYLLDQAERKRIPVVLNWSVDDTVRRILERVMRRIAERFPPDPAALD
jgi:2-phosphoglycerate kinase